MKWSCSSVNVGEALVFYCFKGIMMEERSPPSKSQVNFCFCEVKEPKNNI